MGQECHFFPLMVMLWICRYPGSFEKTKRGHRMRGTLVCSMCHSALRITPVHVIFHFSIHGICTILLETHKQHYYCTAAAVLIPPSNLLSVTPPLPNPLFSTLHSPLSTPLSHSLSLLSLFSLSPSPSSSPSHPSFHSSLSSSHYQVVNFFVQFSKFKLGCRTAIFPIPGCSRSLAVDNSLHGQISL
jgi:hypothetical protein